MWRPARSSAWLPRKLVTLIGLPVLITGAAAADWPQYRGPNHDGISTESIRTNWAETPPRQVWKVSLGAGLSSFSVAGGKAYTMVKRSVGGQNREVVVALDAATGAELWARPFDTASYPDGGVGSDDGPRSTPTVDGDYVYAFGAYLKLVCLRASDGTVVWTRDFVSDQGASVISWQNAASPLLEGDLIYVNCNAGSGGRLLAVDKATGTNVWRVQSGDRMTQSTPVIATVGGVRQVIFLAQSGLVSLDAQTGALLWRHALSYSTSTSASPVVGGDMVYAAAAYGSGAVSVLATQVGGIFSTQRLWRSQGVQNHWCTPVHWQGHLYGQYNQSTLQFKCLELATGTVKWLEPDDSGSTRFGYGAVMVVGGKLLISGEDGELVLAEPDPSAFREIGSYRPFTASSTKCWNGPAFSNGRIYFRSTLEAVCLDVADASALAPTITSAALPGAGTVGMAYHHTVTATGTPPITFSAVGLPAGLTLDPATGVIAGTPTMAGTNTGTITAANGTLPDATQAFSVVISAAAPVMLVSVGVEAGGLVVGGTGPANGVYHVLASTDPTVPIAQWVVVATNSIDGGGVFRFTNAVDPGVLERFFTLRLP